MRGEQIAAAGGWVSERAPSLAQIENADVIVAVKRVTPGLAGVLRGSGKPIIWDPLDFWKQPEDAIGIYNEELARKLVLPWIERLRPKAIIATNKIMAQDLWDLADIVEHIYHHADPFLSYREHGGKTLVYEGAERYLGKWRALAEQYTAEIGWSFRVGPPNEDMGAMLAVRDGDHGSWLARRWKSNVKAANAIVAGVPLIAWPEHSYEETIPWGHTHWFTDEVTFRGSIKWLANQILPPHARPLQEFGDLYRIENSVLAYNRLFEKVLNGESCSSFST